MTKRERLFRYLSFFVTLIFLMQSVPVNATTMESYCIVPPYVKRDVKPNILIMMDNSQNMGDAAYTAAYDPTKTYSGYFRANLMYSYATNEWKPDNGTTSDPNSDGQPGAFSGNLLNWVTTSKYDLLESILVGGISTSRQSNVNTLVSKSNSWSKTYSACVFNVNNANLTITETAANACTLLNSPPVALAFKKKNMDTKFAKAERSGSFTLNIAGALNTVLDFLSPSAYAGKPLMCSGGPGTLTEGTVGVAYSVTLSASGGMGSGYTWSISSGSLPPGLSLSAAGVISGTPTTAGTYNFTAQVGDGMVTDTKLYSITINAAAAPGIRTSSTYNVRVCVGDYTLNCDNAGACTDNPDICYNGPSCTDSPTQCILKTGIVYDFWSQARFGIEDFNQVAGSAIPNISNCIEQNPGDAPDSDFLTAVENAVPIDPTTTLVNGEYTAVDYFANNTSANCNPFSGSQPCLKNFILMITAGAGADNPPNPSGGIPNVFSDPLNCGSGSYYNLTKNACYGYSNDLRPDNITYPGKQYVSTYVVNTMGTPKDNDSVTTTTGDILAQAATAGGGIYYEVTDPTTLRAQLILALQDIIKRAAAGTAASVLASGEGSGANLVQAIFYPRKKFYNSATSTYDEIMWTGRLTNLWYYIDPFFVNSNIREDTTQESDRKLNLQNDYITQLYFDSTTEATKARRWQDSDGDGDADGSKLLPDIEFESLKNLWEAGVELWKRTSPRTIYVTTDGINRTDFSTANAGTLRPYLVLSTSDLDPVDGYQDGDLNRDGTVNDTDANILIRYVHGEDFSAYTWFRSRTVAVDLNGDGDTLDTISGISESPRVWKLGDVLNSTPKISSWIQLNTYNSVYNDSIYSSYLNDPSYTGRGMVYTGANDGMLHAFKLGLLELEWTGQGTTEKARLLNPTTPTPPWDEPLGEEMWAFIPKNVLPYLKYLKEPGYCHVYTVDLTPYVFDASIGAPGSGDVSTSAKTVSDWRTILIGGMRLGGACKNTCADSDCIQTPSNNLGYSSYFALDVTDQTNPQLLWEFTNEDLGLTTTGPTVIKISPKQGDTNGDGNVDGNDTPDNTKNGYWYVVIGSGPTGTVSTTDQQFLGRSNQNLRLFILNLKTGALVRTIDTGIQYAFAGSMLNSSHDSDLDYQDDAVYIPYVKKAGDGSWTQGGIGRILTKEETNPSNWAWSQVIDDIGPVTSSVVRLQHKTKGVLWLYFGTGRYYFEQMSTVDDGTNQRHLFGITEPCFQNGLFDTSCTTSRSLGDLTQVNTGTTSGVSDDAGWYIALDPAGTYTYSPEPAKSFRSERMITDPLSTTSGLVFFTTYKPYDDVCAYGGKSFIWALKYDTGAAPGALLKGKGLLQVSTGSIEQIDLSAAFTEAGGRKTTAMEGVPPTAQGLSILGTPPPVKRVIHMKER